MSGHQSCGCDRILLHADRMHHGVRVIGSGYKMDTTISQKRNHLPQATVVLRLLLSVDCDKIADINVHSGHAARRNLARAELEQIVLIKKILEPKFST